MTSPDNQSTATADTAFTKALRYKVGLTMIIVGNLGILMALVLPALGVGAGAVGALVVGGEIVSLASIVFLGKEGFKAIKSRFFAFVKSSYTGPVGLGRHYVGITLLATNFVIHYIVLLYLWDAFGAATTTGPPPVIWGLDFAQQESLISWFYLICEIAFLSSIYVLGADWWGKFRNMVVWKAPAD